MTVAVKNVDWEAPRPRPAGSTGLTLVDAARWDRPAPVPLPCAAEPVCWSHFGQCR